MAAVVAGLVGVGGVWLLWKHTLGAGPFKGVIVLEVQVRHHALRAPPLRQWHPRALCPVADACALRTQRARVMASVAWSD